MKPGRAAFVMSQEYIEIRGARENNLKNVSLRIPKRKITIFTGVSGSGKSSIVFDTVATEAQRQMNENFSMFIRTFLPRYSQPDADAIENLSMPIVVDQKRLGGGSHSTMGTITDIYSVLRRLYSHIGKPHVGHANVFSFNDPKGMCPNCNGLGRKVGVDLDLFLDKSKTLNEGAILFHEYGVDSWGWNLLGQSKLFDMDKKLSKFSEKEMELLLYSKPYKVKTKVAGKDINLTCEGSHQQIYRQVHHARREDHVGTYTKGRDALHHDGAVHGVQGCALKPGSAEVQDRQDTTSRSWPRWKWAS